MQAAHRESAERMRSLLANGSTRPGTGEFREALMRVPGDERDAWVDGVFGLDTVFEDGPELPRGCVPYLPCAVDVVLRMVEHAGVQASDVFVDVGAGAGRAAMLVHLLTGASAIGVEIQQALVQALREMATRLNVHRVSAIEGDAALLTGCMTAGSVFFLYCPFSGERLETVLGELESIARTRQIRVCCVDLPLPPRSWLTLVSPPFGDLAVYRSTLVDKPMHPSRTP